MEKDQVKAEFQDILVRLERTRHMVRSGNSVDAWFTLQGIMDKVTHVADKVLNEEQPKEQEQENVSSLIQQALEDENDKDWGIQKD
tara:strand:- start:936 stop:1193 length:258 start_codon:yes stop_codon:yes gene_type:complete